MDVTRGLWERHTCRLSAAISRAILVPAIMVHHEASYVRQNTGVPSRGVQQVGRAHDMSWVEGRRRKGRAYDLSWSARLIPNFFMRLRRVLGCRLRILAAPCGPSITPLVCCNTARIWRFSTASSVRASGNHAAEGKAEDQPCYPRTRLRTRRWTSQTPH